MTDEQDRQEEEKPFSAVAALQYVQFCLGQQLTTTKPELHLVMDGADDDAIDVTLRGKVFRIHVEDLGPA